MVNKSYNKIEGFTLVELLVAVAIFTMISVLTLANYPKFNTQTSLTALAQQVAISIREAQVYGVAVRNSSSTASIMTQEVYPAYGIFFATTSVATTNANATAYSIFYDRTTTTGPAPYFRPLGDGYLTDSQELVETVRIQNGNRIIGICGVPVGQSNCTPAYSAFIVFRRPNPDAIIKIVTTSGTWPYTNPTLVECGRLDVTIQSRDNAFQKTIQVYSSGQISVQ